MVTSSKEIFIPGPSGRIQAKYSKSKIPKYIPFVPGACMVVESKKILRWNKSVYEELYESVSWQANPNPHPVEAWHFERLMLYFFYYEKYFDNFFQNLAK